MNKRFILLAEIILFITVLLINLYIVKSISLVLLLMIILLFFSSSRINSILIFLLALLAYLLSQQTNLFKINSLSGKVILSTAIDLLAFFSIFLLIFCLKKKNNLLIKQNITDVLTGLYNRRGLQTILENYKEICEREKTSLAVLFLDIDNFKYVNDTYGHKEGDKALKTLAGIIKRNVRDYDISARLGGDEFSVIMMKITIEKALSISKLITSKFIKISKNNNWNCTLSIGVVVFERIIDDIDVIKKADELMYIVKNSGKNDIKYEVIKAET